MPSRRPNLWGCRIISLSILLFIFANTGRSQANQTQTPSDQLKNLSLEQLGDVQVITASKEPEEVWQTPAAIYVVTQEDIRRSGATSIPEILQLVPGVEVAQEDSDHWSISIRGFGAVLASKILVLIDGRSVYTPLFAGVYWEAQATPIEDIDRIEVIRGPGGTIWGANAVDGIINIITKSSKETHGLLAVGGGGNAEPGSATVRYGGGNAQGFNYRIYGMGFDRSAEDHSNGNNFDAWSMGQAGFRTDWDGARDSYTVQGDIYDEVAGEATQYSLYSPPSQVYLYGNAALSGGNVLARWKHVYSDKSDFQIQAYYDHTHHFEPEFGENRDTFDVDFLDHLTLPGQENFLWGLGARVSPSSITQLVATIDFLPHNYTDQVYSAFLQDEIPIVKDKLSITIGSKFEHNNYSGFEIQPSGRLLWTPTQRQSFWASITRAVRTPSRIDEAVELTDYGGMAPGQLPLYLRVLGNPDFVSEVLVAYETGYRALVTKKVYFDVALFHNVYSDVYSFQVETPFVEPPAPATPERGVIPLLTSNGIAGTTNGFEIAPDYKPTSWLELKGSYSYLHMHFYDVPGSNDPTSVAGYEGSSPHHEATLQALLNLPKRFEFDQTYRYVSALPAQMVGSYITANVRLGWHINPQLEVSVVGQNLLQPSIPEFGGDPGPLVGIKRSVYAKLVWRSKEH